MAAEVRCDSCGSLNLQGAERCRLCGKPLVHRHVRKPGTRVCEQCGGPIDEGADTCNACTRPVRDVVMSNLPEQVGENECVHWSEKPSAAGRSARVAMAGILILIAGALGVGQGVVALDPGLSESLLDAIEEAIPWTEATDDWVAEFVLLQAWTVLAGLLAIAGGIFALTRTRYELALMGGVFGIAAIGFLMGAFLALVAVLLLATSRKEFLPEC